MTDKLEAAIALAVSAHRGQRDRDSGLPYVEHPLRVMAALTTPQEKIVGVLHDVVERTSISLAELRAAGFDEDIVAGVDAMSKREGEAYDDYIGRVMQNRLAVRVKLADLCDNMDLRYWTRIDDDDTERLRKYLKAYKRLSEL